MFTSFFPAVCYLLKTGINLFLRVKKCIFSVFGNSEYSRGSCNWSTTIMKCKPEKTMLYSIHKFTVLSKWIDIVYDLPTVVRYCGFSSLFWFGSFSGVFLFVCFRCFYSLLFSVFWRIFIIAVISYLTRVKKTNTLW